MMCVYPNLMTISNIFSLLYERSLLINTKPDQHTPNSMRNNTPITIMWWSPTGQGRSAGSILFVIGLTASKIHQKKPLISTRKHRSRLYYMVVVCVMCFPATYICCYFTNQQSEYIEAYHHIREYIYSRHLAIIIFAFRHTYSEFHTWCQQRCVVCGLFAQIAGVGRWAADHHVRSLIP